VGVVGGGLKLTLKNFDQLKKMLDANRFTKEFKKQIKQATKVNALTAADAIKVAIAQQKVGDPNHPLTQILKGSSKPLIDSGDLSASINGKAVNWNLAFIGVLKEKRKKGLPFASKKALLGQITIAALLHEGVDIKVTDKMRRFFTIMAMKHPGKIKPLKAGTTTIHIPGRPFLEEAFALELINIYKSNWEDAINETFRMLKRR
jgi:hypothetical protein